MGGGRRIPVVQQNVRPPDLVVGESDVGHSRIVGDVPAQVDISPVLRDKTAEPSFRVSLAEPTNLNWCFKGGGVLLVRTHSFCVQPVHLHTKNSLLTI